MADNVSRQVRSRTMSMVKSRDTRPELVVRRLLHQMGYRYRLHVSSLPGTPDIVFASRRKIVNVHGCFWHMHCCGRCRIPSTRRKYWTGKLERNRERDRQTLRALRALGWDVLTIWECQSRRLKALSKSLERFLGRGQASV